MNRKFGRNKCEQSKNRIAETYCSEMTKHHLRMQHSIGKNINQNESNTDTKLLLFTFICVCMYSFFPPPNLPYSLVTWGGIDGTKYKCEIFIMFIMCLEYLGSTWDQKPEAQLEGKNRIWKCIYRMTKKHLEGIEQCLRWGAKEIILTNLSYSIEAVCQRGRQESEHLTVTIQGKSMGHAREASMLVGGDFWERGLGRSLDSGHIDSEMVGHTQEVKTKEEQQGQITG